MAVLAVLGAISAAASAASGIVNLVRNIRSGTGTGNLDDGDLKKLEESLAVLNDVPRELQEMRATLEAPAQKAILGRDDRKQIQAFLEEVADQVQHSVERIKSPLDTLNATGQKLSSDQVKRMSEGADALINSVKLDDDAAVRKTLERKNLFTLALLVDSVGAFATRDYSDTREVRDSLNRTGRFTAAIREYES